MSKRVMPFVGWVLVEGGARPGWRRAVAAATVELCGDLLADHEVEAGERIMERRVMRKDEVPG